MNDKPAKIEMVTLKQLCTELKLDPVKLASGFDSLCEIQGKIPSWLSRTSLVMVGSGRRTQMP